MVYGATGHTGRFVVDELLRRGLTPVLAGRSAERLAAVAPRHAALDWRVVGIDDPVLLRQAVSGAGAVVNCAGPFLDTAAPLARAAVEEGAHYLDVTAEQPAVQLPFSEVITIARHLEVGELRSHLNTGSLADLRESATPPPSAADESGRSAQRFVVDVVVRDRSGTRRITCTGRDIYAVSAPIIVEGAVRLLDGRHRGPGAVAPGEAFDAADVLAALERDVDGFAVRRDLSSRASSEA
jgi:hypothetical protein